MTSTATETQGSSRARLGTYQELDPCPALKRKGSLPVFDCLSPIDLTESPPRRASVPRKRACQDVPRLDLGALHHTPLSSAVQCSPQLKSTWAACAVEPAEDPHPLPKTDYAEPSSDSGNVWCLHAGQCHQPQPVTNNIEFMLSTLQRPLKTFLSLTFGRIRMVRLSVLASPVTIHSVCSLVLTVGCQAESPAYATFYAGLLHIN